MLISRPIYQNNKFLEYNIPPKIIKFLIKNNIYIVKEITDSEYHFYITQSVIKDAKKVDSSREVITFEDNCDDKLCFKRICGHIFSNRDKYKPTEMDLDLYAYLYDFNIDELGILDHGHNA